MQAIVIYLAHANIPAADARMHHLHQRREGLAKGMFRAVGLGDGDL